MQYCDFVADAADGNGVVHCQKDRGHEGQHKPPISFDSTVKLAKDDAEWRKWEGEV